MGRNKKEALLFTFIMCALMVLGMSIYNVALMEGWSGTLVKDVIIGYIPAFVIAFILDVFVVGKVAKGIAYKLVKENDPMIKKIMFISFFMVTGMVLFMSFYGAVLHVGFTSELPMAYLSAIGKNFMVALPLQILLVGPLTRFIFVKITPATA
ncbi:sterol desaturase/sphingolipid hydroxylase (fatty acid hydroxylase superfamily) [Paenibacillus sp. PastF-3]|jgi:hypothetical protein|uniref:DUF2798 domain-containing protein n=1 Tax=unclassified Paenibacillus TaxID=185978 RepID=UPI000B9FADEF|nr:MULTISPECIES: DUF2798 domain-containing protein [unclassified Paenibacillus]MDH6370429.1 sterol desaturase/sphingolipid hydroxylase (fatty acid hydroxylase superfamily) [Paenibacillus sp. PastF-3]OZQ82349.1 DUF2798 domain-containing protein [Paenibacillus sp. VTT E-133291]